MEERVSNLDQALAELAHAQMRTEIAMKGYFARMDRAAAKRDEDTAKMQEDTQRMKESLDRTNAEMKEDTQRMKESMDHTNAKMQEDTQRMKESLDRTSAEMKEDTRRMQKAWGDLANKMGTVAEDVVAPNIPRLAVEEFGLTEVEDMMPRARRTSRRGDRRWREYDIVCAGPDKVIVVEVKSTPTLEKIQQAPDRLREFFDFFPEYEGRELIGVFASWSIDEQLLPAISEAGLYGIAMGEDTMDVVARPGLH